MTVPQTHPERIDLARADDPRDVVHRAVACLAQGGIVGLATETVYGLSASALQPSALVRLRKQRSSDAPTSLTLLLKGPVEVADWVPDISELGWRLARRAWPGPVTLIFPRIGSQGLAHRLPAEVRPLLFPEETVALRVPAHPFIREILRLSPAPLVLSKALGQDRKPATTADSLASLSDLGMILDDGPTQLGGVSTAVMVENGRWEIIRPGVVDAATLTRMAGTIILFVCTGNTCRSPMAEALCKRLLAQRLGCSADELEERGFVITSAGMAASAGMPAASNAIDVVRDRGGSLEDHASQQLTPEMVRHADHIITMTNDHLESLLEHVPECAPRTRLLHPDGGDVDDPVGADRDTYLRTACAIEKYLELLLASLKT